MDFKERTEYFPDSRTVILKQIERNPGIRYRELQRLTSLTNGGLQYHLKILERSNKVKVDRHDGRRTRYYPLDIPTSESHILGCVRNNVSRQIVLFILEHDQCTFGEVVEHTTKAQSTVSWHLKRLSEVGIISISYGPEYQLYSTGNKNLVKKVFASTKRRLETRLQMHIMKSLRSYSKNIDHCVR
jgi:predicted transcriptional regulator